MRLWILVILIFSARGFVSGQAQTVGLFFNDSLALNGYTLFSPLRHSNTYLIDNCGEVVHTWTSEFDQGLAAFLLDDGDLLRTGQIPGNFIGGGLGGRIERFDWDNNLIWSYTYVSPTYHQHHDIEPLPNGNVLILAWELIPEEVAEANGRKPTSVGNLGLWSEHLVEVRPVGTDSGEIVWEWHVWDHLVQDYDISKPNYGTISAFPGRIDVNYGARDDNQNGNSNRDWLHCNSVSYNPVLDQIVLSSRNFNEIWVIDHSTTSAEAASDSGGVYGRGGNLLYRWGNPETYQRGTAGDRVFFLQHDARWDAMHLSRGSILVFNNGSGRPTGNYSSVDRLDPPFKQDSGYLIATGKAFGPDTVSWTWTADPPEAFFSPRMSGSQRLPNGNILVCEGLDGRLFEIDTSGVVRWEYLIPVSPFGLITQGSTEPRSGAFRALRYAPDAPAFSGKTLETAGPLELNPLPPECTLYEDLTTFVQQYSRLKGIRVFPVPARERLHVQCGEGHIHLEIVDLTGQRIYAETGTRAVEIDISAWTPGVYFLRCTDRQKMGSALFKILKL